MNEHGTSTAEVSVEQKVQYELEKEKERTKRGVTFEYSEREDERLRVEVKDDMPFVVANRAGMLALAKLLLKLGTGRRNTGFQLHLRENFDSERGQVLRILLEEENPENVSAGQALEPSNPILTS